MKRFIARHKFLFAVASSVLVVFLYVTYPWPFLKKNPEIEGNSMSLIYAFAASKTEGHSVEKLMNRHKNDPSSVNAGRIGTNDVVLFITGIGPKKASSSASAVLLSAKPPTMTQSVFRRPDAVLVIGTCGSLTSSIGEGEIIVYSQCLSSESKSSTVHPTTTLVEHIISLLNTKAVSTRSAVGISTARIATTKSEKLALAKSGAEGS